MHKENLNMSYQPFAEKSSRNVILQLNYVFIIVFIHYVLKLFFNTIFYLSYKGPDIS